jgi:hypothetical protein
LLVEQNFEPEYLEIEKRLDLLLEKPLELSS